MLRKQLNRLAAAIPSSLKRLTRLFTPRTLKKIDLIHGYRNVVWLLVRVETPRTRVVLDLVSYDACAARGVFRSEFLLLLTRLEPSSAVPIRGALRHSVFWHLGFWEWMGAAAVFGFFCATVFLTSPIERRQRLSTS